MPEVAETVAESIQEKKDMTLTRINQYKLNQLLGTGAYGSVYQAGARLPPATSPAPRPRLTPCDAAGHSR